MKKISALLLAAFLAFPLSSAANEWRRCVFVIDGDTIVLEGGERVRLIGVDAPEVAREDRPGEEGGVEAAQFLRKVVEGRAVRLEYDIEARDRYGRTLAYVHTEDGRMANEEIIAGCLAVPMRYFSYKYKRRFFEIHSYCP